MWLGKNIGNENKISKHQNNNVYEKVMVYEGGHLSEEDVISLNDGNYVTDAIILFFINILRKMRMDNMVNNKIKIVDPSVAHLMKTSRCLDTIANQKNEEKLNEYDWVMYPVNNDAPEGNGGTHWSLLVYRKRDNKFLHLDPIRGLNKKHAVELMLKIQDVEMIESDGYGPQFVEIPCEKQKNGFDCGPFVMIFMDTILENIERGREFDDDKYVSLNAEDIRENLRYTINKEIEKQSGKKVRNENEKKKADDETTISKEDERKEKSQEKRNDGNGDRRDSVIIDSIVNKIANKLDNTNLRNNNNSRNFNEPNSGLSRRDYTIQNADTGNAGLGNRTKDNKDKSDGRTINRNNGQKCKYFINDLCKYGRLCRYRHTIVCRNWKRNGNCGSDCGFDHPEPCMDHLRGTCQRRSCWYLHILERTYPKRDTQREKTTSTNKQQKHKEGSEEQKQKQIFRSGPNKRQEKQKEEESEENRSTHQQSINMVMVAMETLQKGIEQILLHTTKH